MHVDIFSGHKSLQYVFTQKELTFTQKRWLDLLEDCSMSLYYHLGKTNIVADTLRRLFMGSLAYMKSD